MSPFQYSAHGLMGDRSWWSTTVLTINHSVCSHHSTLQWDSRHMFIHHILRFLNTSSTLIQIDSLWKTYQQE